MEKGGPIDPGHDPDRYTEDKSFFRRIMIGPMCKRVDEEAKTRLNPIYIHVIGAEASL